MKRNARLMLKGKLAKGAAITIILMSVIILFNLLETVCAMLLNIPSIAAVMSRTGSIAEFVNAFPVMAPWGLVITGVFGLLAFLCISPLRVGLCQWYYGVSAGEDKELGFIFDWFSSAKRYFKSLLLIFDISVRSIFWTYLLMLPGTLVLTTGTALLAGRTSIANAASLGTAGIVVGTALIILGVFFSLFITARYFLAIYIFAEQPEKGVHSAVARSVRYMRGNIGKLVYMYFSFLPWALLSILLLPALYAHPYLQATKAIFARYAIEKGRLIEQEEQAEEDTPPETVQGTDEENI